MSDTNRPEDIAARAAAYSAADAADATGCLAGVDR